LLKRYIDELESSISYTHHYVDADDLDRHVKLMLDMVDSIKDILTNTLAYEVTETDIKDGSIKYHLQDGRVIQIDKTERIKY